MKKQKNPNTYTLLEQNMYLTGMFGQNIIYNVISAGLAFYLQSVIFLPAMAISIIFLVARVWDAINDPMMGTIADKTRTKYGKCRPYLLVVPGIITIITILCFVNGIYSVDNSASKNALIIAWAAISYVLWGMSYTVGDIPLWGITALMTQDENDRSKILALSRIAGGIAGGLVLAAIVPVSQAVGNALVNTVGNANKAMQYGFIIVAVVLSVIGGALFQLAGIFTKERVSQSSESHTMKENFKLMWSNVPFRQLLISGILRSPMMLLMVVAMTLLAYYYGDNGRTNYTLYLVILGGGIFGGQFLAMGLTPKLIVKTEKKKLYNMFSIGSAVPFALIFVCYLIAPSQLHKPLWLAILFVLFTIAGAGLGGVNVLQSVMIADTIDYEEYEHNIRPDGVFFSGQSFVTKLTSGIAAIIQGVVFAIVGFSGSNVENINNMLNNGASFKSDPYFAKYSMAMFFLCSIPPAIGMALSVIPMRKYTLTDKEHGRILAELNKKRNKGGK